ncbi:NACHT domain-containing protein [Phytohabitans rumicis]
MLDWVRDHKWSVGDILALLALVVAVVGLVAAPGRRAIGRWWRAGMLRAGRPQHRYASWFVKTWGVYDNPYLEDKEDLDLTRTFVSLSFHDPDADREVRAVATHVLADRAAGNMVIEGDPGSGKSTLLKAYGVGVLRPRPGVHRPRPASVDLPFLVQLRKFSRYLEHSGGLADYLVSEILVSGAGMDPDEAGRFLAYLLERGQVVVMLDGLDEVTDDRQQAVLEAVYRFTKDSNRDRPTYLARIIVTCRKQNFRELREQWIGPIADRVCTLAPLRNSEVFSYLNALRSKFKTADGPESFLQAVRASGTLDLHRTPLVLAMSVGLYARKDYYEIPSSIAELYQTMIKEMLDRHRFKRDPVGNALRFPVGDKYRLLREFALASAREPAGFDEFEKTALVRFAEQLAPHLDSLAEPRALVDEIVDRSGLLSDVVEGRRFIFGHRSIQEHLVAEELRLLPDGADVLVGRATDAQWRQVILFYTAGLEQRSANDFLPRLSAVDPALAGHCLGRAKASDGVATAILDRLTPDGDEQHLSALIAATISPRASVQEMAVHRLATTLTDPTVDLRALRDDIDGLLPLLSALAGTNAARIAGLVPRVISRAPDDPRLVEPLWRCLTAPGIEAQPECATLISRLLTLVMDPDGFAELIRLDPYERAFLTPAIRGLAYPFTDGLPVTSNLVTLLAWAEYLKVTPPEPNRFYEARAAGRLGRVERDRARSVSFSLFWPGRVGSVVGSLAALAGTVAVLAIDWRVLVRPFGWWSLLLHIGLAGVAFGVFVALGTWTDNTAKGSWPRRYFGVPELAESGHWLRVTEGWNLSDVVSIIVFLGALPLTYAVALAPVASWSLAAHVALATLGPLLLYWLPLMSLCSRAVRFHPYRPNPCIDMYDDPRSRHWLVP